MRAWDLRLFDVFSRASRAGVLPLAHCHGARQRGKREGQGAKMECGLMARKLCTGTGTEALTDADVCGPLLPPRLPFCTSLLYPSLSVSLCASFSVHFR